MRFSRMLFRRILAPVAVFALIVSADAESAAEEGDRPNILLAISDDQSFPHASAYGSTMVQTPAFDRVAREGVLFNQAFAASPGCSPCRAALLTGRHCWQIEHAGTHASEFPSKYVVYPRLLEESGYFVGYTGKGWGPGNYKVSGRDRNPAGPSFSKHKKQPPHRAMSSNDYAANFADFLQQRPDDRPFCFWYGASEPHRGYENGAGLAEGKKLEDAEVPTFLPDNELVRSDLLDYGVEIEWFDTHLGRMLAQLEEAGELESTLIIVTSDNGMPFPRAKANNYEYGIHMPLAICWKDRVPGDRVVDDVVGFVDLTATILDAAGVTHPSREYPPAGKSLMEILTSEKEGWVDPSRTAAYSSRERHSSSRWNNLAYPIRSLRTPQYLYIRNFRPERWPAGAPRKYKSLESDELGPMHGGYHDIDACPTLDWLIEHREAAPTGDPSPLDRRGNGGAYYFHLAVDHRPAEELYDIKKDPGCLKNLADDPRFTQVCKKLSMQLETKLRNTGDPRILDGGDIFETYKRYSHLRKFPKPDWAKE